MSLIGKGTRSVALGVLLACAGLAVAETKAPTTAPAALRVAIYTDGGGGQGGTDNVGKCLPAGDYRWKAVTAEDIRAGVLKDYDVLVQPGGSGSKQAETLKDEGRENIRSFVKNGGGYVGICAGSYLATTDYTWSLGLLNAKVLDRKHWARGTGTVQVRLSEEGKTFFGVGDDVVSVYYGQGPLLSPDDKPELPQYTPLGTYETEIAKNGAPAGVMLGTTAIATAKYGEGRVICISPHFERAGGLHDFVKRAVTWASGREDGVNAGTTPTRQVQARQE